MDMNEAQQWIKQFYGERGWAGYGPFIRVGFLMEEAGETARAVRAYEIGRDRPDEEVQSREQLKQDLVEEIGDVLGNISLLADLYDISLEEAFTAHQQKLLKRFGS
ncbi:NTP pyrophosphatase, house-cleaning of non-canonical NTPs [Paenibacillus sp. cl141a]|uniref:MazG nucleotide pyrophosphohydrolase domain-containing protein n=1 Tax=Paenibacillus sp. cl141a TaxID=1761877 RepID=UPI0008BB86E8|nr:MazG-like family protein [Paenibacillus sp. cl141a]SEL56058.1 NTP pyrophosphatase, house-cleaning of non-canonical NTPs [Paenibacillus sp. cl141a]